jgi:hypothetical protein
LPKRTNEFQRLIAAIQSHLDDDSKVTESAMLPDTHTGTMREVDITVAGQVGGQSVTISIECRDRSRKADVTWVEQIHAKHSRLPTNVLVLAARKPFTREARDVANLCGIRCHVLDDVDDAAADRLFPTVQSLKGKGWEITIHQVTLALAASGELPAQRVLVHWNHDLFRDDGTQIGKVGNLVGMIARSRQVFEKMSIEARPEHKRIELAWDHPRPKRERLYLQNIDPVLLRCIEQVHLVAECTVTVDEFPLRHANFGERVKVAWGTGDLLGQPAMVVATALADESPRISLHFAKDI